MSLCHAHTPIKETLLSFGSYVIWILKEPTFILLATSYLDLERTNFYSFGYQFFLCYLDFLFFWLPVIWINFYLDQLLFFWLPVFLMLFGLFILLATSYLDLERTNFYSFGYQFFLCYLDLERTNFYSFGYQSASILLAFGFCGF